MKEGVLNSWIRTMLQIRIKQQSDPSQDIHYLPLRLDWIYGSRPYICQMIPGPVMLPVMTRSPRNEDTTMDLSRIYETEPACLPQSTDPGECTQIQDQNLRIIAQPDI